jgi:8-oxo-dGTP pyrophosphatase MutT (NUDIX family)
VRRRSAPRPELRDFLRALPGFAAKRGRDTCCDAPQGSHPPLFVMQSIASSKRLSCGIVIVNQECELLLCHVTGRGHWDLPKGGIDTSESPIDAALRETREETGLVLAAAELIDLGRFVYSERKDLHLFATRMQRFDVAGLWCESHFAEHWTGKRLPEMDAYGWFGFERAGALCTPKLARLLRESIDLAAIPGRFTGDAAFVLAPAATQLLAPVFASGPVFAT